MHLALQTEYSFKQCFGQIPDILDRLVELGHTFAGIADIQNTFGHVQWEKECQKRNLKPIFGVRLNVVSDNSKQRRCDEQWVFIAKNEKGLEELYQLVQKSYDQFYYTPRLFKSDVSNITNNIFIFEPRSRLLQPANKYIDVQDRGIYQILAGSRKHGDDYVHMFSQSTGPSHILTPGEMKAMGKDIDLIDVIVKQCSVTLPHADMVKYKGKADIDDVCRREAKRKGVDLDDPVYKARYDREMKLIKEKDYVDYFMVVGDMIAHAKKRMFVGPSRGSSAGSLVCYLLGIVEIDPIKFGLVFERFIDVNRLDLPDIDIDFPDRSREGVIKYLAHTYGRGHVRCLGTVNRLMPKSAIGEFAKGLGIPAWETDAVKGAIIERSSGDARAQMCIADTLETTDPGKELIKQYPKMKDVAKIEGHAHHAGKHAAGILVSTLPLTKYGGVNSRDDIIQLGKHDAAYLGLLKIDCLGLRTLSILEDAAKLSGMNYLDYYTLPLDDQKTFDIFNDDRLQGVFQFEGYALQSLTRQMGVQEFNDIIAITALARPGPLNSGGATMFAERRTGRKEIEYLSNHPAVVRHTEETLGIIIYQEQLMTIGREFGNLSWEDVSDLRKAASKSLGEEFFGKFKDKFMEGARNNGVAEAEALKVWENMITFGSWGFNKSHAVAYGLISYWTAYMKAHHPLEFAAASLNNAKSDDQAVKLLRDITTTESIEYVPVDPDVSEIGWSINNGKLIGGLTNIKGVAELTARKIIKARKSGDYTPALFNKLMYPETPFDILFPTKHYWGEFYTNPDKFRLIEPPIWIQDIDGVGEYMFIGCLVDRNLRDLNEYKYVAKRGTIIDSDNLFLNFTIEDDTGSIICTIDRYMFNNLGGKKIAEEGVIGESWYIIKGTINDKWRKINVSQITNLNEWKKEYEQRA